MASGNSYARAGIPFAPAGSEGGRGSPVCPMSRFLIPGGHATTCRNKSRILLKR